LQHCSRIVVVILIFITFAVAFLPDRLMAGPQILVLIVLVRIQLGQLTPAKRGFFIGLNQVKSLPTLIVISLLLMLLLVQGACNSHHHHDSSIDMHELMEPDEDTLFINGPAILFVLSKDSLRMNLMLNNHDTLAIKTLNAFESFSRDAIRKLKGSGINTHIVTVSGKQVIMLNDSVLFPSAIPSGNRLLLINREHQVQHLREDFNESLFRQVIVEFISRIGPVHPTQLSR
jgi:hypothetical protein